MAELRTGFRQLPLRVWLSLLCLAFVLTPWFKGGQDPLAYVVISTAMALMTYLWLTGTNRRVSALPKWTWLVLGAFIGYPLLSLLWTNDLYGGVVASITLVQAAVVFMVSQTLLRSNQQRNFLINLLGLMSIAIVAVGIIYYLVAPFDRATSLFLEAGPYSLYLGIVVILGLYKLQGKPSRFWQIVTVLALSSFWLTQNLTTSVVLVAVLAGAWWLNAKGKERLNQLKQYVVMIIIAVVFAVGLTALKNLVLNDVQFQTPSGLGNTQNSEAFSLRDQRSYWQNSLRLWKDAPLIGHGVGSFKARYPEFQQGIKHDVPDAHNAYLQLMGEMGFVGLMLLLTLLWFIAQRWLSGPRGSEQLFIGAAALLAGAHIFFYPTLSYPTLHFWLPFLFSYLVVITRPRAPTVIMSARWASLICVATFVLLVPAGAIFRSQQFGQQGDEYFARREIDPTQRHYESANQQLVSNPHYLTQEALMWWLLGEVEIAKGLVNEAIQRDPYAADAYNLRAYINKRLGDTAQAVIDYQKAIQLDPYNNPDIYYEYVDLLVANHQNEDAKLVLDGVLPFYEPQILKEPGRERLAEKASLLYFERARLALSEGETGEAKSLLRQALDINPKLERAEKLLQELDQISQPAIVI